MIAVPSEERTDAEILASARAVAAEDEEQAGVAMVLALEPGALEPGPAASEGSAEDQRLARLLGRIWDLLVAADPDVTVQDAQAVLADLELRSARAVGESGPSPRLAAWRPDGFVRPSRAARDAEFGRVRDAFLGGRLLRVVNHHDTPVSREAEFRAQLHGYAERFDPVTAADVRGFLRTGRWTTDRPGVVPAFFDGFASAVHCAAPLLAETGLVGWFYPPTEFLDTRPEDQRAFAARHDYGVLEHPDGPLAMTWDELAALAVDHEVCGHTATHAAAADVRTDDDVTTQVRVPVQRLREVCGRTPAAWAWLGGSPFDPAGPGDRAVAEAGIELMTSNAAIESLRP
jgi:hypothetical protein